MSADVGARCYRPNGDGGSSTLSLSSNPSPALTRRRAVTPLYTAEWVVTSNLPDRWGDVGTPKVPDLSGVPDVVASSGYCQDR